MTYNADRERFELVHPYRKPRITKDRTRVFLRWRIETWQTTIWVKSWALAIKRLEHYYRYGE